MNVMAYESLCEYRGLCNGSLIEHRSTYLNDVDQLAAIQLSVLIMQKRVHMNGMLSSRELFLIQQKMYLKKRGLLNVSICSPSTSDILEIFPINEIYISYISFMEHCNLIDNADVKLCLNSNSENESETCTTTNKTLLDDGNLLSPISNKTKTKTIHSPFAPSPGNLSTMTSPFAQSPKDPSNLQVRRIIISYLQLISNSRNEIALARIIDVPTRGIDHKSFTDIRKLATDKGMPMYQVISSFVRQVLLGGKGYAPDEHHVLFKHKQGLLEFIDLMDNLQTILDEGDTISSVLILMLKFIKTSFIRVKNPVFSAKTVSTVIQELLDVAKTQFLKKVKDSKVEVFLLLRDYIDFMSCLAGNEITVNSSQLCGILSTPEVSSTTYKKISTLVTHFSTPELCEETPKKLKNGMFRGDIEEYGTFKHTESDEKQTPVSSKSDFHNSNNDIPMENPIKLIRCPIGGNLNDDKRTITKEISKEKHNIICMPKNKQNDVLKNNNSHPPVKRRVTATKGKSKCVKKIKLLSGQKTLNQFFTK